MKALARANAGITLLGGLGFENAYALAMPPARAQALGIRTLADLAGRAPQLVDRRRLRILRPAGMGGASRKAYGLDFREQRQMQPEFMYPAAAQRRGRRDRGLHQRRPHRAARSRGAGRSQGAPSRPMTRCCWFRRARTDDRRCSQALPPLIDAIDVALMREANLRAASGASPSEAARWLWKSRSGQKIAAVAIYRLGCFAQRQRVDAEIRLPASVHTARRRPAGAARQRAERLDRILVAVLGVDGLAGAEVDALAGTP